MDGSNLSATCEVTVLTTITPGDVNGDRTINVGDYVTTANYILEKKPQPFIFEAADIDCNNSIDVGDLVAVANLALHYEGAPLKAAAMGEMTLNASMAAPSVVAVNVLGASALQFDVTLPAGMSLAEASASNHDVAVNSLASGAWRVLVSSPTNRVLTDNVTFVINGNGEGNAVIDGIVAAKATGATSEFAAIVLPIGTTGINDIVNNGNNDVIYNLQGQRVTNPSSGIYIKGGKKVIIR